MYIFAQPLGYIIRPIYELIQNYGITLIIVTILVRVLTIPLTIMSQKSTTKTQMLQPEMAKIQAKYKNDKEKMSQEIQKLYTKHGVNPMGGCLPLIVQMFVLFGFIRVVYDPLQYILQLSKEQISHIMETVGAKIGTYQVTLCGMDKVKEILVNEYGKTPINFDFFGIDLTQMLKGNEGDLLLWIFPVLATLATVASSYLSKKQMASTAAASNGQAASMSNSMMYLMPIMTGYFTYIMPAGMSLYWFVSTAFQLLQQTVINDLIKKSIEKENTLKGK